MYLVIEMQTNAGSGIATILTQKATMPEAESLWHTILAAAAVSSVEVHSASVLNEAGKQVLHQAYAHSASQPEPAPGQQEET